MKKGTLIPVCIVLVLVFFAANAVRKEFLALRRTAEVNTCIPNLKQIDGAELAWALEKGKHFGDVVEWSDLVGTNGYIKNTPTCQAGGKYTISPFGVTPTCSISNHNPKYRETPGWFGYVRNDWPQWLGPNRDGRACSFERELESLAADLKPLWRIQVGGAFSSPVIAGNKLVYFDENGTNEVVHLLDAKTGKEVWQTTIAERYSDEWGAGPRSTPTIDVGHVYVQSCEGEFRCLDLNNGKIIWGTSFEKDWGVKFLGSKAQEGTAARRGNNGSAVIPLGQFGSEAEIVVPVGSTNGATLVSFNKLTGKVAWKCGDDEAAYSSVQVATLAGVKQVVYISADALMGVDLKSGKLLWRVPLKTNAKRHAATPVILPNDRVVVNSHTFGLLCLKISKTSDGFAATEAWSNKEMKINLSTPVLVNGYLYSQGPKQDYVCVDAETGALKWLQEGFGKQNSSTIAIGNKLLVLTDDGQLVLLSNDPQKCTELGRVQVCGKNWNYPAYAQGKLYVRDARELACYELVK